MLSEVQYELLMILEKGESYSGKVKVIFNLKDKREDHLFLDFHGKAISEMKVNGTNIDISNVKFESHKVYLPRYLL